jgi:hypothetical protein
MGPLGKGESNFTEEENVWISFIISGWATAPSDTEYPTQEINISLQNLCELQGTNSPSELCALFLPLLNPFKFTHTGFSSPFLVG